MMRAKTIAAKADAEFTDMAMTYRGADRFGYRKEVRTWKTLKLA